MPPSCVIRFILCLTLFLGTLAALAEASVEWRYTASGQRERMIDGHGTTLYSYDDRERLVSKASPEGTLSYSYDAAGNLLSISSARAGGAAMAYGYDALNRLAAVAENEDEISSYQYDAVGNLAQVRQSNEVIHQYAYTALNRLSDLAVLSPNAAYAAQGGQIARFSYARRPAGHRSSAEEMLVSGLPNAPPGSRSVRYQYDSLDRLARETIQASVGPAGSTAYTLDAVGNRLNRASTITNLSSQALSYDANDRIAGDQTDNNGNTRQGTLSQPSNAVPAGVLDGADRYDSHDRLIERSGAEGVVRITYDGDGVKVRESVVRGGLTTTTLYLVDTLNPTGYAQVVEELQNGALQRVYTYGHDLLVMDQRTPTGVWEARWYAYDGHGSVRLLTDGTARATDRYDYDAFGNVLAQWVSNPQTGALDLLAPGNAHLATPNTHLYSGEAYVPALGLYHLRARLMNPLTGRFWTMDSYEGQGSDPASLHKYLYANADAVNRLDLTGHYSINDLMAAMGVKNYTQAAKAISANNTRKKAVKILGCVAGVESLKKYMDYEFSEMHHPIPRGMGGSEANLLPLPSESHRLFHFVLHILLKESDKFAGLHNYSSADSWRKALSNRATKKALLTVLKKAGAYVDKQCDYPKSMGLVRFITMNEKEWLR
jgi:RHS repeat-associated protein